jgi:hypothetical protein
MGDPVVHFEVLGKDGAKLQGFYGKMFGWKIDANNPMQYGVVDADAGGKGIGGGVAASQDGSSSTVFYVEVKDIDAKLKQITAAGGKVIMPRTVIPNMVTFAQFTDPAGNTIGLVESGTM